MLLQVTFLARRFFNKEEIMKNVLNENELERIDHPRIKGGMSTTFFSKEKQGAQATVGMVKLPKGGMLPWHDHGHSDDIIMVLEGRGLIEMDGIGVFEIKKGSHVLVPGSNRHRIYEITEDLTLYHVKAPPTV